MSEEKIFVVGGGLEGKAAIAKVFTDQGKTAIFVDEAPRIHPLVIDNAIPIVNPYMPIEKVQVLKECKGRHTYVRKSGSTQEGGFVKVEWSCKNCGHQL